MSTSFFDIEGLIIPPTALKLRRAVELVAALSSDALPFASLAECRVKDGAETIVFDVRVERPQERQHDIRETERLAATFEPSDHTWPEVIALRRDFPLVPHLNLRENELPRSLCLYEDSWDRVRLTWSAPSFIEWIRRWLALTVCDELHRGDQTLEPLMFSSGYHLILPIGLDLESLPDSELLRITAPGGVEGRVLCVVPATASQEEDKGIRFAGFYIHTLPRRHGVIRRTPRTLKDLCELVRSDEFDLLQTLRARFRKLPKEMPVGAPVMLLLGLPKKRSDDGPIETIEEKAFVTSKSLKEFGTEIGVWSTLNGQLGQLLYVDESKDGSTVEVDVANVGRTLSWSTAARLNCQESVFKESVVGVGAGALGSQVAMNLARSGWGRWTIIDNDVLLPHNMARHALFKIWIGLSKAEMTARCMNGLADDHPIAVGLSCDFLRPGARRDDLEQAMASAHIMLDMSASIPVARHLAKHRTTARCLSLFLSPSGRDLVLLAEDEARNIRLDQLEMYYYRDVALREELRDHLVTGGGPVRYGASCRDVSSLIPQEWVAVHAGVAAQAVRRVVVAADDVARVWRIDPETNGVVPIAIELEPFVRQQQGQWELLVAPTVIRTVAQLRRERLPRETGGILIGGIDHDRKIVYLVMALPSPPDSQEQPTMYIRGAHGLRAQRDRIFERTASHLDYLGEWHSHPEGFGTLPSLHDRQVFAWIAERLFIDGRPPVMVICGDNEETRIFVETLDGGTPEPVWPR